VKALAVVALTALVFPAAAFGHANLVERAPNFGQRVEKAPRAVVLHFDQGVIVVPQSVKVLTERGASMTSGPTRTADD
jgi:methionine-rich copper-binding protein CopC